MPPYYHATWHGGDELKEKDLTLDDEEYERSAAGEDGLGSIAGQGWDDAGDAEGEEEEGTWLQDDDIEDWD